MGRLASFMADLYIGLMSGTSLDGIDAVVVDFSSSVKLRAHYHQAYTKSFKEDLQRLFYADHDEINRLGRLDIELGKRFAEAVFALLKKAKLAPDQIKAIGSVGQTIRHNPEVKTPFTIQIGDPNTLAALTAIPVVADFRRRDMAVGGQGAPLVPIFHQAIFYSSKVNRIILNLGGIANITALGVIADAVKGFDTGPGNALIDAWSDACLNKPYDEGGRWAIQGEVDNSLLNEWMKDRYFHRLPPKSTGKDYFNLDWIKRKLKKKSRRVDVQRTLTELTAQSVVHAIQNFTSISSGEIIVCGGGARNKFLLQRLQAQSEKFKVYSSKKLGWAPESIEATAMAWLAKQRLEKKIGNLPSVTGARKAAILGGLYF